MQGCSITPASCAGEGHGRIESGFCVLGEEEEGWGWRERRMASSPVTFSSWNTWPLMEILSQFELLRKTLVSSKSEELRWRAALISDSWKASQRKPKVQYRGGQKQLQRQGLQIKAWDTTSSQILQPQSSILLQINKKDEKKKRREEKKPCSLVNNSWSTSSWLYYPIPALSELGPLPFTSNQ